MATTEDYNHIFTATEGATGTIIPFTFHGPANVGPFDADGLADLSGYTVTATVRNSSGTILVDAEACVVDPDQTLNKSKGTWTMSQAAAAIAGSMKGIDYRLKFKAEDGAGNEWFAPTHPKITANTLRMISP